MDKRNFTLKRKDWMSGNWEVSKFGLQILTSMNSGEQEFCLGMIRLNDKIER